jgi:hypothetical protein
MDCNLVLGAKRQILASPWTILSALCPDYASHDLHHCLKTKTNCHDGFNVSANHIKYEASVWEHCLRDKPVAMGGRSRGAAGASAPPTRGKSTGTPRRTTSRWNVYLPWRLVRLLLLCLLGHKNCIIACWATGQAPKGTSHDQPSGQPRISVFDPYSATIARLSGSPTTHD